MVNYSSRVTRGVWLEISDNEAYVLQNKGTGKVLVKASNDMPTSSVGSIEVYGDRLLTSSELSGRVW